MKKRLYLIIENYNRELESRIYLGLKAANLGWSIVIGNKANIYKQIKNFQSGIFFIKSVGPRYVEIIDSIKKYGNRVVATDEENIVFWGSNQLLTRMHPECLLELDSYYCWGKREFDYLSSLFGKFKEKFIITGNPRIDVLKNPLNKKYINEANELKKKKGNFILLNSGFGKVVRASKTDWVQDSINAGKLDTEEKIQNEKQAVKYEADNLDAFVELVNFLTDKLPNQKFILRTHPAEDDKWFRNIFKSKKNLEVNTDKITTNVFITASQCLIAHNCITLLEAYFLNKKCLNFIYKFDKRYEHELISNCSTILSDKKDILKFINSEIINQHKNFSEDIKKNITYSIRNSKNEVNSVDNILKNLDQVYSNVVNKNVLDKNLPKFFFLLKVKSFIYKLYNLYRIYYTLLIRKDSSMLILHKVSKNKRGTINTADINNHLKIYKEILKYKDNFKVYELYKNVFCIEKSD